jgi:hypothetical protein
VGILEVIATLGLAGAAISAAGGYVFRVVEGYQERKRERRALLRVLYHDIYRNRPELQGFENDPAWITGAPSQSLKTKNWLENKIRLSQLLDDKEWFDIAIYFDNLVEIDEFRRGEAWPTAKDQDRQGGIYKQLPLLQEQQRTAVEHISKYISIDSEELRAFGIPQRPNKQLDVPSDSQVQQKP